jgi:membrane protein DedA with SNARE-associated domain
MIHPLAIYHAVTLQHAIFLHLRHYRYWLIFFGTFIEGEVVLMSASVLAYFGVLNVWLVALVALCGTALASDFWFWVGRRGGEPFIHRYGKFVGLSTAHVARVRSYLNEHGAGAVVASKFVFGTKTLCALFAGALGMSSKKFHVANVVGSAVWVAVFAGLSYGFARSFRLLRGIVLKAEITLLILVVLAAIITLLFAYRNHRKDKPHG